MANKVTSGDQISPSLSYLGGKRDSATWIEVVLASGKAMGRVSQ